MAARKHASHGTQAFANMLDESEISTDLKSIFADWQQHASKFNARNTSNFEADAFTKNGQLHYCDLVIEKGQQVILTSEVIQQDFYGTVTTINPTEVRSNLRFMHHGSRSTVTRDFLVCVLRPRCS